jgi:threonine dehydratase
MRDIPEAARALCRVTPLLHTPTLGCRLKLESQQRTGSVQIRGAALKLSRLAAVDRTAGVVAASAGNQGLALACVGRKLGIPVRVVVPESAPRCKREAISSFGAELIRNGATPVEAEKAGRRLAALRDALFVSPCEDLDVIEGDGSWLGQELLQQGAAPSQIVVPMGHGGLAAGLASAVCEEGIEVIGVQPEVHSAMSASLACDRALTEFHGPRTLCEELEGGVGWRSFRAVKQYLRRLVLVTEGEIMDAVAFAFQRLGLIVEPSAAVVLAAVCSGRLSVGERTVLLITGGNLDGDVLQRCLSARTRQLRTLGRERRVG